jgi:curved DNA-binding protein CbpA
MNKYFNNTNTLEELRKQYKELLKQHHPDNGGNVSDMQEINSEYDRLFKILKNQHESNKANSNNTNADYNNMKYDFAEDEKLREMLNKIIHFKGIDIELVGAWIWVSGNTYSCKKELKELCFKWASQKKMWYWHSEAFRKKSCKTLSMDDIRSYYGSTNVKNTNKMVLMQV